MGKETKTKAEQKILELLKKECREWILESNKEVVLCYNEKKERMIDSELYNKITTDIENAFAEEIKTSTLSSLNGFLYGRTVRIAIIKNDKKTQYLIRFYGEHDCKKKSNLAKLRKNNNMSQAQLAIRAGVSVATIRNYEQNPDSVNAAQYQTLDILSQVLGCQIKDIISFGAEAYSLEELFPDDKMREAVRIVKNYLDEENDNKCIFVTGTIGSGVSTVVKCLSSYMEGSALFCDSLILQDVHKESKEMLCIRLKKGNEAKHCIESVTLVKAQQNEVLWNCCGS